VSELVATMRGYTRLDEAPVHDVDLAAALETTLGVLGARLGPSIVVERDFDPGLAPVPARAAELNQVWTALLENALDAMGGEGVLRLATRREGERAVVEVGDSGPGVPREIGQRVFEPFFTTKEVGRGAGLGLDAARRIVVVRHGGELGFTSRPGDTRFIAALPLDGPPGLPR
jgi:signal transduction histidine kinase